MGVKPIDWGAFPAAEIACWDELDRELATLVVRLHQNLDRRIADQEIAFVKLPAIAGGLSDALWYADESAVGRVRDIVITALILGTDRRFKDLVE